MRSLCIAVPLPEGERMRKKLSDMGVLDTTLRIQVEGGRLLLPLARPIDVGYEVAEREFEELEMPPRSYRELLDLPGELMEELPKSFDIIGDVAIIKLPGPLVPFKVEVGEALMGANRSLRSVALDSGVEGEYRVRSLEVIVGDEDLETTHREYGLEFRLDPRLVYFSPRLATEHWRVAQRIEPGSKVLDMFAGVGPFALAIGRYRDPSRVYAVDINPEAIRYLNQNIRVNKVDGIEPILGDIRAVSESISGVDAMVMNLPHRASEYLDVALRSLADEGALFFYLIADPLRIDATMESIIDGAPLSDVDTEIVERREVHGYSPGSSLCVCDLRIIK